MMSSQGTSSSISAFPTAHPYKPHSPPPQPLFPLLPSLLPLSPNQLTPLPSPSIDEYVPEDFGEPDEADLPEGEEEANAATLDPNEDVDTAKIIEVGGNDPAARGPGRGKTTGTSRDKKIPKDKRNTTPFMTKYERARVLGTRALQIRFVFFCFFDGGRVWEGRGSVILDLWGIGG